MIRKLAGLLRLTAHYLEEPSDTAPADADPEESEEQPAASVQTESPPSQEQHPPPPPLWQRFLKAERERLSWLRDHPYVIGIALGLAIAVALTEQWLIQAWNWLVSQVRLYWPTLASHPLALIAVGLALFYLVFGFKWLRSVDDFLRWVFNSTKRRPRLMALITGLLILIVLWIVNNQGTWIISPFTVGQLETISLNGEQATIQLIAELNQVGVGNPTPVLVLWELQEPRTLGGRVTARRSLPLGECEAVLEGPGDFTRRFQPIPLTRVLAGSQGSRLDLGNLSIGVINIPSQIFTQFLLKILPTGYREFNGQINENKGEIEISVSSTNPPLAWRIAGPSETFPEMIEYLALRMALDLNPELIKSSGLDAAPSDRDLAFAMGNQAFRQQRYQRAQAFYLLADHFAPLDEKVDAMLALSYYHLALEQSGDDPHRFDTSLQAMEAAVDEDPNGDGSLLRPYLACLYHKAGMQERAEAESLIFTQYLRRLEFQDFEVRAEALKQLALHGPGRHLYVAGSDVIFLNETGNIVNAMGQPLPEGDLQVSASLSPPSQNPRQIQMYGDTNVLFISADGAVLTYDYQSTDSELTPTTLIEGLALSGVQQIGVSDSQFGRTNLFLLNRFGRVYWCEPDAQIGSVSACPPPHPLVTLSDVRQIFPVKDRVYMLASDGAVWYTEINLAGGANFAPRQLTPPAEAQEIFLADDGTLYLLHDNGNVWRYYNDGRPETEDLKLIDPGIGTAQIFSAGGYLYLLKSNGAIWRIGNPRNPNRDNDFSEIWTPPQDTTIQEIFVTASTQNQDTPGRTLYLLTEQRTLLRGVDNNDARVAFSPVTIPTPEQAEASQ